MNKAELEAQAIELPPKERAALAFSLWNSLDLNDRQGIVGDRLAALRNDIQVGIEALDRGEGEPFAVEDLPSLGKDLKRRGRERQHSSG